MSIEKPGSPKWSSTFKMVIGLTIAALLLALLFYFRSIIGPLLLAFILVYLLHPIAAKINTHTKLSWRSSVTLIYLVLLILLIPFSPLMALPVVQQIQSLIKVVDKFVADLPTLIDNLSKQAILIGPYSFDLSKLTDLGQLSNQIITALQSVIGKAGTIVGTLATATATTVGWILFILVVSYFVLADTGKVPSALDYINLPGYSYDIQRMSSAFGRIWNVFLRGQLTIVVLVIITYTILLSILGVPNAFGVAVLAGLARFVPYVGPLVTYIVMGLVILIPGSGYLGLPPGYHALLAIGLSIIMDQVFDNLVSPRIMGKSLGVNPGAVLVVALIAAKLIGLIGLLLAAPALASFMLLGRYTIRKLFDRDPWADYSEPVAPMGFPLFVMMVDRINLWWNTKIIGKLINHKGRG